MPKLCWNQAQMSWFVKFLFILISIFFKILSPIFSSISIFLKSVDIPIITPRPLCLPTTVSNWKAMHQSCANYKVVAAPSSSEWTPGSRALKGECTLLCTPNKQMVGKTRCNPCSTWRQILFQFDNKLFCLRPTRYFSLLIGNQWSALIETS